MKKWLLIVSFMICILAFNSLAYAGNDIIQVSMNGSKVQVKEVPIMMDGQAFISDVPSFVYVDRTLVPVRFVAESFGADVQWDQKTKTATVLHDNKVVKLTIDSNKVVVNNQGKTLDNNSIPKLVTFSNDDSRTMVPVRFISEVLGYNVGWDSVNQVAYINSNGDNYEVIDLNPNVNVPKPEVPVNPTTPEKPGNVVPSTTASINGIKAVKGSTENHTVVINSNQPIKYNTLFLPDSNKLVIDIENSILNIPGALDQPGEIRVSDKDFTRVTYSQYTRNPYSTRIVVELEDALGYKFYTSDDGKTTTLAIEDNEFKGVKLDIVDGKEAVVIEGLKDLKYNVMKLKAPERIVIDLMDTNLSEKVFQYDIKTSFINGMRVSQFAGDKNYSSSDRIVRVVIDVLTGVENPDISIDLEEGRLVIHPEQSVWDFINYDNTNKERLIKIKNIDRTNYDVNYFSDLNVMMVTIPKSSTELQQGFYEINDRFLEDITITENNEDVMVSFRFKRPVVFNLLSDSRAEEIELSVMKDPSILFNDITVVLDPGHGGKDPGAISPNGTKEKDVNLVIGLKTQAQLEALGYDVIMTRTTDTFVDLYERARIANRNNADIFISIHHNSTLNNGINGLEILYCPRGMGTAKVEDQFPLAEAISKGILASTKGADRGIIQRPGLVVIREANMSAVLIEVGYLSNSRDEMNIINDAYQNKVVEGIINGIQAYFE